MKIFLATFHNFSHALGEYEAGLKESLEEVHRPLPLALLTEILFLLFVA